MKNGALILFPFLCLLAGLRMNAQSTDQIIQKGNELYKQKKYDQAEAAYKQALDKEQGNATATFNRANALYRQAKPDEAIKLLDELVMNTNEPALKARAYYNKGAILSGQKKTEESIEAYKNALRQNPDDKDARENLQKALLELKKKNPPKEDKKKQPQQQKKQQQQPQMNQKEAQQQLKLLEQKEKDLQQRMQKEKSKAGGSQQKDW
jgi:Ca-activated chloride channel homolog